MAREQKAQANKLFKNSQTLFGETQGLAKQTGDAATALYSTLLLPTYTQEATNPQGYAPEDVAGMNTAAQQSAGGAVAAAKGAAGLRAARTGNRGGSQIALDESVRNAMRSNSENALNIQKQQADKKLEEQQAGISGLQGLYGTNQQSLLASLGLGNNTIGQGTGAVNAGVNAQKVGWLQDMNDTITALANAKKAKD